MLTGPMIEMDETSEIAPNSTQFDAKRFITAGKAIFTLQGKEARYTYRVSRSEPDAQGRTVLFISLLTGTDNTSDYTYLGLLEEHSGAVRLPGKSRMSATSKPVVALSWACKWIWAGRELPAHARLYHMGRCGRCGRALTVPSSIETGVGPECAGRLE